MNFYYNAGLLHLKAGTGDTSTCEEDLHNIQGYGYTRLLELQRGYQMLSSEICSRYGIEDQMLSPETLSFNTLPDAALPSPP